MSFFIYRLADPDTGKNLYKKDLNALFGMNRNSLDKSLAPFFLKRRFIFKTKLTQNTKKTRRPLAERRFKNNRINFKTLRFIEGHSLIS